MDLTPQQEKFAQCVADGMSQADAYRLAYPKSQKWKPETLHPQASKMMAEPKIATRVKELRSKLEQKALWTREMSIQALNEAIGIARDTRNAGAITGAVKEINAMHGFNAATKHELTGANGSPLIPAPVYKIIDAD